MIRLVGPASSHSVAQLAHAWSFGVHIAIGNEHPSVAISRVASAGAAALGVACRVDALVNVRAVGQAALRVNLPGASEDRGRQCSRARKCCQQHEPKEGVKTSHQSGKGMQQLCGVLWAGRV